MKTPKQRKRAIKGGEAQQQIAKEAKRGAVPLNRQVNLVVEEMDRFLAQWCQVTEQWYRANKKQIDDEHTSGGGETGMTGKSCLLRSLTVGANRLLKLAQTIDDR